MFNDFYMGWTECSVLYARASCRTRLFLSLVFRGAVSVSPQAGLDRKGMLVLDGGPQLQLSSTVLSRSPSCKVKHSLCFCLHPTYLCNEIRVIADWWMSGGLRRGGGRPPDLIEVIFLLLLLAVRSRTDIFMCLHDGKLIFNWYLVTSTQQQFPWADAIRRSLSHPEQVHDEVSN